MKLATIQGALYISTSDNETFYLGDGQICTEHEEVRTAEIPYRIYPHNFPRSVTLELSIDRDELFKRVTGCTPYQWHKQRMDERQFKYWKRCQNRKRTKK